MTFRSTTVVVIGSSTHGLGHEGHTIALDLTPEGALVPGFIAPVSQVNDVDIEQHVVFERLTGRNTTDRMPHIPILSLDNSQQINIRIRIGIPPGFGAKQPDTDSTLRLYHKRQ